MHTALVSLAPAQAYAIYAKPVQQQAVQWRQLAQPTERAPDLIWLLNE